jgi:hypothetical protein
MINSSTLQINDHEIYGTESAEEKVRRHTQLAKTLPKLDRVFLKHRSKSTTIIIKTTSGVTVRSLRPTLSLLLDK